jgi:hypothetical protein
MCWDSLVKHQVGLDTQADTQASRHAGKRASLGQTAADLLASDFQKDFRVHTIPPQTA